MEISPQSDVTLRGGDVFPRYDLLPFSVIDAVFTVEIHPCNERGLRLQAVAVIEPYQKKSEQDQKQNSRNGNVTAFEDPKFVFEIRHDFLRNEIPRHS
jgi:hypothetical protein